jgi:hypothetical protein
MFVQPYFWWWSQPSFVMIIPRGSKPPARWWFNRAMIGDNVDIVVVWWDIACMTTNQYIYIDWHILTVLTYTRTYTVWTNPYWESHPSSIDKQASKRGSVMVAFVGSIPSHWDSEPPTNIDPAPWVGVCWGNGDGDALKISFCWMDLH